MTLIAVEGTIRDKINAALHFCEINRVKAERRLHFVRQLVTERLTSQHRNADIHAPTAVDIGTATSAALGGDRIFKDAVNDERWGHILTQTYTQLELLTQQRRTNALLEQLITALHELTLVDQSDVSTVTDASTSAAICDNVNDSANTNTANA